MTNCGEIGVTQAKVNEFLVSKIPKGLLIEGQKFFNPVKSLVISSPFAARKINGTYHIHEGVDISRDHRWAVVVDAKNAQLASINGFGSAFGINAGYGYLAEITSEEDRNWTVFVCHLDCPPLPLPDQSTPAQYQVYNKIMEKYQGTISNDLFIKNQDLYFQIAQLCVEASQVEPIRFYSKRTQTAYEISYTNLRFGRNLYNNRKDPPGDHLIVDIVLKTQIKDSQIANNAELKAKYDEILRKAKNRQYLFVCSDTGYSLGSHFHLELRYTCVRIDPLEAFDIQGGRFATTFIRDLEFFCQ